jgi:EAL domain-containing protein (putative c-di-GMP-specific phosphodiesterase class I)
VLDRVPRQIDNNVKLILERLARCVAERLRNSENVRLLQFLSAERRNQAKVSLALIKAAETALSEKAFLLYYQPKFELQTGKRVGFEALLRWRHSDNSVLAPAAFAEILDHPDLSRRIGSYVLRCAVAQAKAWERAGIDFGHIAINVSSSQFAEVVGGQGLVEELLAVVEEANLNPDKLQIEITEGVVLSSNAGHVAQKLEQLRAAGFAIAFDDFGTGFASLVHLKDLQYDQIKIDGSFVRAMTHSSADRAIVKAVVDLARSLGKDVVAEGIETEAEFEALRQFGCRYGQGYLFGRPSPPSKVG